MACDWARDKQGSHILEKWERLLARLVETAPDAPPGVAVILLEGSPVGEALPQRGGEPILAIRGSRASDYDGAMDCLEAQGALASVRVQREQQTDPV